MKAASRESSVLVLTTGRYVLGAMMLAALFAARGHPMPAAEAWRFHAGRGIAVTTAALSFFWAVSQLPLVVATVLGFTAVLMVAPLGWIVLGERPSRASLAASVVGLLGAGLAASGAAGGGNAEAAGAPVLGAVAAILAALAYALALVLLRLRTRSEPPLTILLLANVVPAAILTLLCAGLAVLPPGLAMPEARALLPVLPLALLGIGVWWLMTLAYAAAPAFRLAPLEYVALPVSAALGALLFGEAPGWRLYAGAAVIVGACLFVVSEERLRARRPVSTVAG